jgi:uncharacterized membrane protein YphA (DoxX/SURF4 family)
MHRVSIITIIFLVLLRLAIGWHFLVEGANKVQSVATGPTTTNKPFSSAGYFREATGPLAGPMRLAMGDPDAAALARLEVKPLPEDAEPSRETLHLRTPPALDSDWQNYLARFEQHYDLSEQQREEARGKLEQAEDTVVLWLIQEEPDDTTLEVKKSYPTGDVLRKVPTAERIREYRDRLAEVREGLGRKMWLFGRDVEKTRLRQAKTEVTQEREGLLRDLDKHSVSLRRSLELVVAAPVLPPLGRLNTRLAEGNKLLKSQPKEGKTHRSLKKLVDGLQGLADATRDLAPLPPEKIGTQAVAPLDMTVLRKNLETRGKGLAEQAKAARSTSDSAAVKKYATEVEKDAKALTGGAAELPEVTPLTIPVQSNRLIVAIDWLTRWGLTVIGACLLLGLFSRTNSWLAAGFLLLTYLAMPAFPWLPAPPQSEGTYVFVNKNVIEMLALCVLGTLPTGRWFGLDAILSWLWSAIRGKRP